MELYLDTANVAEVERLARIFPIAGVTTNPSICLLYTSDAADD